MFKVKTHKYNNWLKAAGYTRQQEIDIFNELLNDVIDNPRWYLDNFEYLHEFRVSWVHYKNQNVTSFPKDL